MSIAVVGCTTVDLIFPAVPRLPLWPRHSEFTPENLVLLKSAPIFTIGGNGANAACIAARCGQKVSLFTNLGRDTVGKTAEAWLQQAGCTLASRAQGQTAVNVTAANTRQQRATFFYAGQTTALPSLKRLSDFSYILICGWPHPPTAALKKVLPALKTAGRFVALDAGPLLGAGWKSSELAAILHGVDLFTANEHELKGLMKAASLPEALRTLRGAFAGHVVVKRGRHGACWSADPSAPLAHIKAPAVKAISTIGAGDSFNGALMAALQAGYDFPRAIRTACALAAKVVATSSGVAGFRQTRLA